MQENEVSIPDRDLMSLQPPGLRTLDLFNFPGSFARIDFIIPCNPPNLSTYLKPESSKTLTDKGFQDLRGSVRDSKTLKPRPHKQFRGKNALPCFYTHPSAQISPNADCG